MTFTRGRLSQFITQVGISASDQERRHQQMISEISQGSSEETHSRGVCSLGSGPTGRRIRKKASEELDTEPGPGVTGSEGVGSSRRGRGDLRLQALRTCTGNLRGSGRGSGGGESNWRQGSWEARVQFKDRQGRQCFGKI